MPRGVDNFVAGKPLFFRADEVLKEGVKWVKA
jgi:hypothetical protein